MVVLAACPRGNGDAPKQGSASGVIAGSGSAAVPPPKIVPPSPVAPHGGSIDAVAVTDRGDAALTADNLDTVRLWPTLDGKAEPRVVRFSGPPKELALGRHDKAFVAASLDAAGGVEIIELDAEGRVLAHAKLPPEPVAIEIRAMQDGMLIVRNDQSIAFADARGTIRGPLAPEPGSRISSLATRSDRALAILEAGEKSTPTWIDVAPDRLAWGKAITDLPVTLHTVELSPTGTRIAGIVRGNAVMAVIDLVPSPKIVEGDVGNKLGQTQLETAVFGFVTDDLLVVRGTAGLSWWGPTPKDPWADPTPATMPQNIGIGNDAALAIGDGLAITGFNAMLEIVRRDSTKRLGYADLGFGQLTGHLGTPTLAIGNHLVWLDANLAAKHATATDDESGSLVQAIDDHHVIVLVTDYSKIDESGDGYAPTKITVRDVEKHTTVDVATYRLYNGVAYDMKSKILAVWNDDHVDRFASDPAAGTYKKIQPLAVRAGATVRLCDDGGAIAVGTDDDGFLWIDEYKPSLAAGTSELRPSTKHRIDGSLFGVERSCAVWVHEPVKNAGESASIVRIEHAKVTTKISTDAAVITGDIDAGGSAMLIVAANEIALLDTKTGAATWRFPIWRPHGAVFTGDDTQVIVASQGGITRLDAKTGARGANACGWRFGLHEDSVTTGVYGVATVCEDEP